jgi:chromosome segregation ATPase
LAADAASARAEAEGYKRSAAGLETEFQRMRSDLTATRESLAAELERTLQDLAAAREECSSVGTERDRARDELSATQSQLDASMSLARQQSLTSQRSLMEVISLRQDLDGQKAAYQEAANLLIPLRVRRALPEPMKAPLRAIKRALRSLTRRTP